MIKAKIYIVLFSLIGLIPLIQLASHVLPDDPLDEKRLPSPEPEWGRRRDLRTYLLGWQDWFNDRYPGRNFLIRLKTQIDYSLFGFSDRIYMGKDGWLFYRNVLDDSKPEIDAYSPAQIDALIGRYRMLNSWLKARGITLVIMDVQLKDEFYGDKLPSSAPRRPLHPTYFEIRRRLKEDVGAVYVDSTPILRRIMAKRPVFFKTDFHWNDPAAFEVARSIVDRLSQIAGRPSAGWKFKLEIETRVGWGGQAAFMPLLRPDPELGLFVKKTWADEGGAYEFAKEPFESIYRRNQPSEDYLPTTVLLGDSFSNGMLRCGFCEHFNSLYRIHMNHCSMEESLRSLPSGTQFLILEFIETAVGVYRVPVDFDDLSSVKPNGF
jgi:hypothetical protein